MSSSSPSNSQEDYTMVPCGRELRRVSKGFKFCPFDSDAVKHYLKNKALGRQLPCDIVQDIDFYSCNPDELPIREFKYGRENEAYFFTYNSTLSNHTTSKGYWKESSEDVEILDEKDVIGYKKTLAFYWGMLPAGEKSNYVMQEYRLNPSLSTGESLKNNVCENLVLCRIRIRSPKNSLAAQEQLLEGDAYSSDEEDME